MKKQTHGPRRFARLFVVLASIGLFVTTVAPALAAELLAGVADGNKLVLFASDDPSDVEVVKTKGLQRGERILGLDVRPATGELYALGSSARLYTIDVLTGHATAVGSVPFTNVLAGSEFGFDFNPTVDRIRIVSDAGLNVRVHPVTGLLVAIDGNLAYASADSGAGLTPNVVAAAYLNNDNDPATGTVLFDIDSERDVLVMQSPPNAGTLVTVGPLGVNVKKTAGFDIAGTDGTAYASLVGNDHHGRGDPDANDRAHLFTIDLLTGAATHIGKIAGPKPLASLTALGALD